MFNLFTLGFVALLILSAYLFFSIDRRLLEQDSLKRAPDLNTTPIDITKLTPAIQHLRNNPSMMKRNEPRRQSRRARLVTTARGLVSNLAFFQRHADEHANQPH
jgi:hypothetical protein